MKTMLWIIVAFTVSQVALALEPELGGGAADLDFINLGKGPWVSTNDAAASTWGTPSSSRLDANPARHLLGRRQLLQTCSSVYGQCGGKNWSGPKCCESGSKCKKSGPWYSQCKPGGTFLEESDPPAVTKSTAVQKSTSPPANRQVSTSSGGSEFSGEATYYQDGTIGACSQTKGPSGFRRVALNSKQWADGALCGTCIQGQYVESSGTQTFKAIIDNLCPECSHGDLDFRIDGIGSSDGRWPLEWKIIPCPSTGGLSVTRENGNQYYSKLKFEGGPSPVTAVSCDGITGKRTSDAFFEIQDGSGKFCKGGTCSVTFSNGDSQKVSVSRSDLGNQC